MMLLLKLKTPLLRQMKLSQTPLPGIGKASLGQGHVANQKSWQFSCQISVSTHFLACLGRDQWESTKPLKSELEVCIQIKSPSGFQFGKLP